MHNRRLFFRNIAVLTAIGSAAAWLMYGTAFPGVSSVLFLWLFLALSAAFAVSHNAMDNLPVLPIKILAWIGGYWLIFSLYSFLLFLLFTVSFLLSFLSGMLPQWREWLPSFGICGLTAIVCLFLYGTYLALQIKIKNVIIPSAVITADIKLIFATDIHLGPLLSKKYSRRLVQQLNSLHGDIIIFGGDMIDGNLDFVLRDKSYAAFRRLEAPLGIYAVYGNHDYFFSDIQEEADAFFPIRFLRNEQLSVREDISLTGMDDYLHSRAKAVMAAAKTPLNILIDHEPLRIEEAYRRGYDLYLAGHTHGGQFFPATCVTNRLYTLNYGCRTFGPMTAVVSCGCGFWGMPFRLGTRAEILCITIKAQKD